VIDRHVNGLNVRLSYWQLPHFTIDRLMPVKILSMPLGLHVKYSSKISSYVLRDFGFSSPSNFGPFAGVSSS
jgi:hypothetical protein